MFDAEKLKITKRVDFPEGSKPWMLRVSPDGKVIYVQTATGSNVVLDARTLEKIHTEDLGGQPITTAWSPDGRYNFVTNFGTDRISVLEPESGKLVKELKVGGSTANVSFRPDGAFGYVAVTGRNEVAVVEMETLEVEKSLEAGKKPMGLIVL